MQLKLRFRAQEPLKIPYNYNYQLESAIYDMLSVVEQSDFWHNSGFGSMGKKFKGFCFGAVEGRYENDREAKKLIFEDDVYLELRSPVFGFIDAVQRSLEARPFITLFDTRLDVASVSLENRHLDSGRIILNAVTPVVVRSTLDDGHTYYYSPDEDEFCRRLCTNAAEKYESVTGRAAPEISLRPVGRFRKIVTTCKGHYINGYKGRFELDTTAETAEFIYDAGLGEKNPCGFGFVKV